MVTRFRARLLPPGSLRQRVVKVALSYLRTIFSARKHMPYQSRAVPKKVPRAPAPLASVVVCAHNQWTFSRACIGSLSLAATHSAFEVILVDDASTDGTAELARQIDGLTVIRSSSNLGFLKAANLGASKARGKYVVFLNNDTQVTDGWLDGLLSEFVDERVAIVGSKLLFPDGTLQEAGGIVWRDGTGANYGRGDARPDAPAYSYSRDVDYVSGAAMAVKRDFFEDCGGFDTAFAPAYFEDTDLCFQAWDNGMKVRYCANSVVFHHAGTSHRRGLVSRADELMDLNRPRFREKWNTRLSGHFRPDVQLRHAAARRRIRGRGTLLFVDFFPRWKHESGGLRLFSFLSETLRQGWRVALLALNDVRETSYRAELSHLGIPVIFATSSRWQEELEPIQDEVSALVVCRPEGAFFWTRSLQHLFPSARVAYDTVDLHSLRLLRGSKIGVIAPSEFRQQERDLALERDFMARADITIVTSSYEEELLSREVLASSLQRIGNAHVIPSQESSSWTETTGLIFVANFNHLPNEDGLEWFLHEVFPLVLEEEPGWVLRVVGSPIPNWLPAHSTDNVLIEGWVEDLGSLYGSARVSLAPLRFGAGVKGKVGEAWSYGVPTVITSVAAEGMEAIHEKNCLVADTPREFADSVLRLYRSHSLWTQIQANAIRTCESYFGPEAFAASVRKLTNTLHA